MEIEENTILKLNSKVYYLFVPEIDKFAINLFELVESKAKKFVMNDDGSKFKKKLSKFDISKDKVFGNRWDFKTNKESTGIIKKYLIYSFNKDWGFGEFWFLGKDFEIGYQECGGLGYREFRLENSEGKKTIAHSFEIKAKGDVLKKIKTMINPILKKSV